MSNNVMSAVNSWVGSVPQNGRGMWIEESKGSVKWINRKDYKFFKHKGRLETVFGVMQGQLGELSKTTDLTSDQITRLMTLKTCVTDKFTKYQKAHNTFILGTIYRWLFASKLNGYCKKILENIEICLEKNLASLPDEEFKKIVKKIPLSQIKIEQLSDKQKSLLFDENLQKFDTLNLEDRKILYSSAYQMSNDQFNIFLIKDRFDIKLFDKKALNKIGMIYPNKLTILRDKLNQEQIDALDFSKWNEQDILNFYSGFKSASKNCTKTINFSNWKFKNILSFLEQSKNCYSESIDCSRIPESFFELLKLLPPKPFISSLRNNSSTRSKIMPWPFMPAVIWHEAASYLPFKDMTKLKSVCQSLFKNLKNNRSLQIQLENRCLEGDEFELFKEKNIPFSFIGKASRSVSINIHTTPQDYLSHFTNLSTLKITSPSRRLNTKFLELKNIKSPSLKELSISDCSISSLNTETNPFPQLQRLNLFQSYMDDTFINYLSTCDALEELSLVKSCKQTDLLFSFLPLTSLVNLKKLTLDTFITSLEHLAFFSKLQDLSLSANLTSDQNLAYLKPLTNLQYLDLSRTTDTGLNHIATLTNLRSLKLKNCRNITNLNSLRALLQLEHLTLTNGSHFTDEALSPLASLPKLHSLDLFYCYRITSAGISHLTNLQSLRLSGDNITDDFLNGLINFPHLQALHLEDCKHVTVAGISHLKNIKSLQNLSLNGRNFTDNVLKELRTFPELKILRLEKCSEITIEGVKALRVLNKLKLLELNLDQDGRLCVPISYFKGIFQPYITVNEII